MESALADMIARLIRIQKRNVNAAPIRAIANFVCSGVGEKRQKQENLKFYLVYY